MWDPVLREVRRLKWPDKFNEFFSNSDGTKLARFRGEFDAGKSNYVSLVEIFDLNGSPLRTIKMNEKPEGLQPPFLIDRLENIYGVDQNAKQTRRVVSVIIAASQSYETISGAEALLIDDVQRISEPQKPMLLLLEDGLTLAAFVRDAKNTGLVSIQYYREGRLVKSVSDPVPQGVAEVRLTITSDGKGVLTQVVSGEKKGLVKVWDIETRKPSDITNAPPIRCVFQWVQGKYAPVWTFADDNIYEGALLEIARTRN